MIDPEAVAAYDTFVADNPKSKCTIETTLVPWGPYKKARVLKKSSEEISFDKECDVVIAGGTTFRVWKLKLDGDL